MSVVAIIQARAGSTRLPGKVLRPLGTHSMLQHVIDRVSACKGVAKTVVATTERSIDDPVAEEAARCGAEVFRGDENDVLGRYAGAARRFAADLIIRITADCPLLDPALVDAMLEDWTQFAASGQRQDYLSNTIVRRYPRGLDTEIFTREALFAADREATDASDREHVTAYIYRHTDRFVLRNFGADKDLSQHRWTVDTQEDFDFVSEIYKQLWNGRDIFTTASVLALLDAQPQLRDLNAHVRQKTLSDGQP